MSVQIVEDDVELRRILVSRKIDDALHLFCEVGLLSLWCHHYFPMSAFWFHGDKDISRAVPFVFVIAPPRLAFLGIFNGPRILEQLLALLLEAEHWFKRVVIPSSANLSPHIARPW